MNTKKIVFIIKTIHLKAEMSTEKIIIALIFEIDGNSDYMVMTFINKNIIMLFQIIILRFKI